jgi:uncharacterized membrane protein
MFILVLAFLIGVVAGLRAQLTAPAAVSWAAHLGLLPLQGTPIAGLGYAFTPYVFTVLALGELINDKLPKTPSRTVPESLGRCGSDKYVSSNTTNTTVDKIDN